MNNDTNINEIRDDSKLSHMPGVEPAEKLIWNTSAKAKPRDRPNPDVLRFGTEAASQLLEGFARCYDDPGWDLPSAGNVPLHPNSTGRVRTGLHIALPVGTVGLILSRYSTFEERGLFVPALLLAAGFRGEIVIPVRNMTRQQVTVKTGERIAQLVVLPVIVPQTLYVEVADLPDDGARGYSGPGSSGR